jgi:hypothetical protein
VTTLTHKLQDKIRKRPSKSHETIPLSAQTTTAVQFVYCTYFKRKKLTYYQYNSFDEAEQNNTFSCGVTFSRIFFKFSFLTWISSIGEHHVQPGRETGQTHGQGHSRVEDQG